MALIIDQRTGESRRIHPGNRADAAPVINLKALMAKQKITLDDIPNSLRRHAVPRVDQSGLPIINLGSSQYGTLTVNNLIATNLSAVSAYTGNLTVNGKLTLTTGTIYTNTGYLVIGTDGIDMSLSTGGSTGAGIINHNTGNIQDTVGLGTTADYGSVSNIPVGVQSAAGQTAVQADLGNATGTQVLTQTGGGAPVWQDQYDSNINLGGSYNGSATTLSSSTGVYSVVSKEVEIPVPSDGMALLLLCTLRLYFASITGATEVLGLFEVSLDGGSTWATQSQQIAYTSAVTMFPWADSYFYNPSSATGPIIVRYKMERASGTTGTVSVNYVNLNVLQIPYSNFTVLSGPLAASVPATAAGSCSSIYTTSTTCLASANITCTPSGGAGGNSYSWSKVSGSDTITAGATAQTCTVSGTHTTSDAGATSITTIDCAVTDSASSTATSGNCVVTLTYNRTYAAISASASFSPTSDTCRAAPSSSCTASSNFTVTASGGNTSYTYSNSITSQTSGYSATITAGATASTGTVSDTETVTNPANFNTVNFKSVVNDSRSTGAVNATASVVFGFRNF